MKISRRDALKGMATATLATSYSTLCGKSAFGASPASLHAFFKSLQAKVYSVLTSQNNDGTNDAGKLVSWMSPGIPFNSDAFDFAVKGISGVNQKETDELLNQANQFSQIVNSIPTSNSETYNPFGEKLWTIYQRALNNSQCADGDITATQKAKLDKFWKLRFQIGQYINIQTDEIFTHAVNGPVMKAYEEKKALYDAKLLELNNARISALNSDSKVAVQNWALNANILRHRLRANSQAWVSGGYKNEIEQIQAYTKQVSMRNLSFQKSKILKHFYQGGLLDPKSRSKFYISHPILPQILTEKDNKNWTNVSFNESNIPAYQRKGTNAWNTNDRANPGLFSIRTNRGDIVNYSEIDTSGLRISFDMAQVNISRPWFEPIFFDLNSWKFSNPSTPPLSDGRRPPQGSLAGYPTSCIFVKNLKMDFAELHKPNSPFVENLKLAKQARLGIFMSGKSFYPDSPIANPTHRIANDGSLEIAGIQMIALRSHILDKTPNPDPTIRKWR